MTCFVDIRKPDGTFEPGALGMPQSEAIAYAADLRRDHPDWIIEINPLTSVP